MKQQLKILTIPYVIRVNNSFKCAGYWGGGTELTSGSVRSGDRYYACKVLKNDKCAITIFKCMRNGSIAFFEGTGEEILKNNCSVIRKYEENMEQFKKFEHSLFEFVW